jgi:hypothetical protein
MGWISGSDGSAPLADQHIDDLLAHARGGDGYNFKSYIPGQVKVELEIAGHRFEREISEKRIIDQRVKGVRIKVVDLSPAPLEEIPEEMLQGVSREAFLEKWDARLGKWGAMFLPQEDGSYVADEIFLNNIADVVQRVQRERKHNATV